MFKTIWELIPKRLFYFLIIGLIFSYLGSFVLNYLVNFNQKKINDLKNEIENIKSEYSEQTRNEIYQSLMHFLMLKYLIDQKKSIIPLINQPPRYLPKFLKIKSVSIDNKNNLISFNAEIDSWLNYARLRKYFESNSNIFKNLKIENFSYNNSTGLINFSVSFIFTNQ
ncbi:MAG: hypothetical protein KatS3mg095_0221 [Candidatus Parcubacteria bacterium]|nr:MAG: hypothetical protein KatS3mg095_0221 [Candidatus Parcubacteria bacterium]